MKVVLVTSYLLCQYVCLGCISGPADARPTVTSKSQRQAIDPETSVRWVELSLDEDDCLEGWLSMDVQVEISTDHGQILRRFSPSCNFTFDEDFAEDGVDCSISSGMCSGFMNSGRIEVRCRGGQGFERSATAEVPCPEAGPGDD